jgi:hypothetical protein
MPTIVDPDGLFDTGGDSAGKNIHIDTALRTIKIRNNSAAPKGPVLDETGVTLQALYSFLKQEWKDDPNSKQLIAYPFPLVAITPEQFEWRFGWSPADDSSRSLIRTAGWREFSTDDTTLKRQYIGTISLGNIDGDQNQDGAGDQDFVYYAFFDSANGTSKAGPFDYNFPGEVNQAVLTYKDSDANQTAELDFRGDILRLFIRQEGKTYDQTDTVDIGLSAGTTLPYNTQRFPLVEGNDLKITGAGGVSDATILAAKGNGQKYSTTGDGSTIEYLAVDEASNTFGYSEDLLGGPFNFGVKIKSASGVDGTTPLTNQELYAWVQYNLRQDSDIEFAAGTVKSGKLADELLAFVGDTLTTKPVTNIDQNGTRTGVAITNVNADDINNTQLFNTGGSLQSFPFSTAISIGFSQDILDDGANAKVFVYYDHTRDYAVGGEIGTSIQLADVGPSATNAYLDSANITLNGAVSFTPLLTTTTVQNPEGLDPLTDANAYFRLNKASGTGANHNVIWKVTSVVDSSNFAAITLDDTVAPINETLNTAGDAIYTHPINSPGALLLDSAGATAENNVAQAAVSDLASGSLTNNRFVVSYAFDNNSQKDREGGQPFDVNVRAIGLNNGTWVEQTATITEQNTNSISVVSAVERNYSDPA